MINRGMPLIIQFLLNLFLLINCQDRTDEIMKVFVCIHIMEEKFPKKEEQPTIYSPNMLSCYTKITQKQVEKAVLFFRKGGKTIPFSEKELDDLISVEGLSKIPKDILYMKKSELEKLVQDFKGIDDELKKEKEEKVKKQQKKNGDKQGKKIKYNDFGDPEEEDDFEAINKNFPKNMKGKFPPDSGMIDKSVLIAFFVGGIIFLILFVSRIIPEQKEKKIVNNKNQEKVN